MVITPSDVLTVFCCCSTFPCPGVDDAAVNKAFDNDVDVDGRRALRAFLADKRTIQQAKKASTRRLRLWPV